MIKRKYPSCKIKQKKIFGILFYSRNINQIRVKASKKLKFFESKNIFGQNWAILKNLIELEFFGEFLV